MRAPAQRRAFTLLEMLATLAALVILLGLMVQLAWRVRHTSAEAVTLQVLSRLEWVMSQHGELPAALSRVPPLINPAAPNYMEASLQVAAMANNREMIGICLAHSARQAFSDLPLSLYDGATLRDGWGTPVVFMAPRALNVGIEPQTRRFFMSAGPDRRFSTASDNLYSYEGRRDR